MGRTTDRPMEIQLLNDDMIIKAQDNCLQLSAKGGECWCAVRRCFGILHRKYRVQSPCKNDWDSSDLAAPAFDHCQFCIGALCDDLAAAEIDRTGFAVDRKPVTFLYDFAGEVRGAAAGVDRQGGATDHAGFAHLPSDQSGVRGSAADGGDDAASGNKSGDVGGTGIGAHENDRVATGREFNSAVGVESGASDRDAGRRAGAACNWFMPLGKMLPC